ncbi:MAG: hypothetical protein Q8Q42_03385 [Nanoarchaeota archaeon]|nr:hypothetical protein [Nanoarchaeota archaeon]
MGLPLCLCGCGEKVKKNEYKFLYLHNLKSRVVWNKGKTKETDPRIESHLRAKKRSHSLLPLCFCNCGEKVKSFNCKYLYGHDAKEKFSRILVCVVCSLEKEIFELQDSIGTRKVCSVHCAGIFTGRNTIPWNKGLTTKTSEKQRLAGIKSGNSRKGKPGNTLGHHVSEETKEKLRLANLGRTQSAETIIKRQKSCGHKRFLYTSSAGIMIKMRSSWEVLYAKYLDSIGLKWEYEKHPIRTPFGLYFPDFFIPSLDEHHEVKGFMSELAYNKIQAALQSGNRIKILDGNCLLDLGVI